LIATGGIDGAAKLRTAPTLTFTIELRDTAGALLEVMAKDVVDLTWSHVTQGGNEQATISLRREFDNYGDINLDYDVRIFVHNLDDQTIDLRWRGFVREIMPVFNERESVRLACAGYVRQLDYIAVPAVTYQSQDVAAIARSVMDTYVVPGSNIARTPALNLVLDQGVVVSATGLTFDTSAREVMDTLASIGGNVEWGVRSDFTVPFSNEIYFQARSTTVNQVWILGDRVKVFESRMSTDSVIRRVFVRGAGTFTATVTSSLGNPASGYKERVMLLPFIADATDATLWATAFFARHEQAQRAARLIIAATDAEIEAFTPSGLLRIQGGAVRRLYGGSLTGFGAGGFGAGGFGGSGGTYSAIGGNTRVELRINRVSYKFAGAALEATVELGETRTTLEDVLKPIEFKLSQLRQGR